MSPVLSEILPFIPSRFLIAALLSAAPVMAAGASSGTATTGPSFDYVAFKIIGGGVGESFNRFRFKGEGLQVRMDGGNES